MTTNNFTEKESLALISQMIKQTQQKMQKGSGNTFLYYGYLSLVIASLVYGLCLFTGNVAWHLLWFLMLVPMIKFKGSKRQPSVVTYIEKAVDNVWLVVNSLFILSVLTIAALWSVVGGMYFELMLPLSILYVGIGTSVTGVITNDKIMTYSPMVSYVLSIYMLSIISSGGHPILIWNLLCGVAFLFTLVIPGHLLNYKSSK